MFWDRFYKLCYCNNTKPNPVGQEIGISSAVLTKWKNGISYPNGQILIKIAKYFDCSVDYLVGLSDCEKSHECEISSDDMELLKKLHSLPDDSQKEIFHMVDYKYDQLLKKRKEPLSPSSPNEANDSLSHLA